MAALFGGLGFALGDALDEVRGRLGGAKG
jgi:hypothetical protein